MKKLFLLSTFLTCSLAMAQMEVRKTDGTIINDGAIFKYNTFDTANDELIFTVANTSSTQSIKVKVLCETLTNTTGDDFQFCFAGNCLPFVRQGASYPPNGFVINANSNTGDTDNFWNKSDSDSPKTFLFKFFQVDSFGVEIGSPVRITYLYDKTLAVSNTATKSDILVKNTVVKDFMEVESKTNGNITIFDFNGKLVSSQELKSGINKINVQKLSTGVYIVNAISAEGKTFTSKIIKK